MQVIRKAGYQVKERRAEDRGRMAEKRRISNPSTVLRTGIEQGILNDEGRRSGEQEIRVSAKRTEDGWWIAISEL